MSRKGWSRSRLTSSATRVSFRRNSGIILFFCSLIGLTFVFYVAIRYHDAELTFDQLSAFESHVHKLANTTVFVASTHSSLLDSLRQQDWISISKSVTHVAFVRTANFFTFLSDDRWFRRALAALEYTPTPRTLGIALFPCGCVLPNTWFHLQPVRFEGRECIILPGFVFPSERVAWVGAKTEADELSLDACDEEEMEFRRDHWLEEYESEIVQARRFWHTVFEVELTVLSKLEYSSLSSSVRNKQLKDGLRR